MAALRNSASMRYALHRSSLTLTSYRTQVWLDVTDIVVYNAALLNPHDLPNSFFHLSATDPTLGFPFDASEFAGHVYPSKKDGATTSPEDDLCRRLLLGSHLAFHLRHQLEEHKGYTSTVGISTTKLISKLVGNLNKPKGQTTLLPPYDTDVTGRSNILNFVDGHDIGKIPGIGFKMAQKLREHVLGRAANYDFGLVYGGTRENVTAGMVRNSPGMCPSLLERLIGGPGTPSGIGGKIFALLCGIDDSAVAEARRVPKQLSIEDSYIRLDTISQLIKELNSLTTRLISQMRIDLRDVDTDDPADWLGRPTTIRLTTRPKPPIGPDGTRPRSFKRWTRSAPLPTYVFSLQDRPESIATRLVDEVLLPLFRRLHPEQADWNISLVNVGVTNVMVTTSDTKTSDGRHIGNMFHRQDDVLDDFRIKQDVHGAVQVETDVDELMTASIAAEPSRYSDESEPSLLSDWEAGSDDNGVSSDASFQCSICGHDVPTFAKVAHGRFHRLEK